MRVSASGGDPVAITKLDSPRQTSHRFPSFLPDNRHFLYYAQGNPSVSGIYLASLDGGEAKRLVESGIAGVYLHPGWLLFARQGTLIAQQFDAARGELKGEAVPVTDPVISSEGINLGAFSASADGRIAYRDKIPPMQLSWFDRTGKVLGAATEPDASGIGNPELSPDDKRIAVQRSVQSNTDIWLRDLARSSFIRFTLNPAGEQIPIWSPDGLRITFLSARSGPGNLYVKATGGAADEELLLESPNNKAPQDWSKDGRFLMYLEIDPNRGNDLSVLDLTDKARRPRAVATTAFDERMGQFSPDGRWVTYATNESGRFEIVVQPFPDPSAKWQVSTNGGIAPRWSADGRELYFLAPDGKMMAAPVTASNATFEAGAPQALFTTRLSRQPNSGIVVFRPQYDVSRDGRFLIAQPVEESAASPITLILNWNSEKRK
jgi:Tol biopolymer transport system component